jgi:hypothetical protein
MYDSRLDTGGSAGRVIVVIGAEVSFGPLGAF